MSSELNPVNKPFQELGIGDTAYDENCTFWGWKYFGEIPMVVAWAWLTHNFQDSVITLKGETPVSTKMQDWQIGFGIITSEETAIPGHKKLNMIARFPDKFVQLESKETIPPMPIDLIE